MNIYDTIVAQSTAYGESAIAIIRLTGKDAIKIANKVFPNKDLNKVKSHTIHFGDIIHKDEVIDEVLVSVFKAPNSYTKENLIEISCHGSSYIIKKIITITINLGARIANKGEFTFRSFINGNMDLSQAEAVADIISSNSKNSHKLAINHIKGVFSNKIKELRKDLIDFSSLLELELDFSEEDVEFANRKKLNETVNVIIDYSDIIIDSFKLNNVIKDGINVIILGKPNVGKSTILNALLNEEKAIISDIPGTTRDIIEDTITIGGNIVRFIDTAGIRNTIDKIEKIGIEKALKKTKEASIILYIIDLNVSNIKSIKSELESKFLKDKNVLIIGNKGDLKIKDDVKTYFKNKKHLIISGIKEKDVLKLKKLIENYINLNLIREESSIMINERHYQLLKKVKNSLINVKNNIKNKSNTDLLAMDVKYALNYLGEITGEITNDEILGNIFSRFCIGK